MSLRYGDEQTDTVHSLMVMTLHSAISMVLNVDLNDIELTMDLRDDLNMDEIKANELQEMIADYFDNIQVDLQSIKTVENLFDEVINKEFELAN